MSNDKTITVLELISDRAYVAHKCADRRKGECNDYREANKIDMKSHEYGQALAYNDAYKIMRAELHRLCNLFQNGALTIDSFGIIL